MTPPGRTLKLVLEYDGSDFAGWQIQAQGRTVQAELARALETLLRHPACPTGAGRTDAGTHARGQVAHVHTTSALPCDRLVRGLNGLLPPDIAVRRIEEAPPDFHARYSAQGKRYRYRIRTAKAALDRHRVWPLKRRLDPDLLDAAAACLPGTHDFAAFCKQDPVPPSFLCRIDQAAWQTNADEFTFEITGNRFLRHMVRILVGTMAQIAEGKRPPQDMATLLASGDRRAAGPTAPADGLCLLEVYY